MARVLPILCATLAALWGAAPALAASAQATVSVTIVDSLVGLDAPERWSLSADGAPEAPDMRVLGTSTYDLRIEWRDPAPQRAPTFDVLVEFN